MPSIFFSRNTEWQALQITVSKIVSWSLYSSKSCFNRLPGYFLSNKTQITRFDQYLFKKKTMREIKYYPMNNLLLWTFITLNCILTIPGRHYYYLIFKWFCKSRCNKFRNFKKNWNLRIWNPQIPILIENCQELLMNQTLFNGLKCDEILYYYR